MMPTQNSSRILLVVSDLHLSQGWDEEGKISTNEDFFFDQSFSRFLKFYGSKSKNGNCRVDLVIAGDMVDLLQVTLVPKESVLGSERITPEEKDFGLGTSPIKSCWKLLKVMQGHEEFFQALAEFLLAGNKVTILPGNHDIEFSLPEVQGRFREELLKNCFPKNIDQNHAEKSVQENLSFKPWYYYEPGLVYVEHGHQYDSLNSFDYFLHPLGPKGFIYLPAGSFFVRYLFNKLENEYPFADNIKPIARFIRFSLKKPRLWFRIGKYISFFRKTLEKSGPIDPRDTTDMEKNQNMLLETLATMSDMDANVLKEIKGMWKASALHHLSKVQLCWRFLGGETQETQQAFSQAAKNIAEVLDVKYVVFGHTHDAGLERLGKRDIKREYVNTGTWTKVFAEGYTERLLKEENEFAYVMVDTEKPKMKLLRWRDDMNDGEPVRLFQSRGAKNRN